MAVREATVADLVWIRDRWPTIKATITDPMGVTDLTLEYLQDLYERGWRMVIQDTASRRAAVIWHLTSEGACIELWGGAAAGVRDVFRRLAQIGVTQGWPLIYGTVWSESGIYPYLLSRFPAQHHQPSPETVIEAFPGRDLISNPPTEAELASLPHYTLFSPTPTLIVEVG